MPPSETETKTIRITAPAPTTLPLAALDFAEWNPKGEISGVERRGLTASLETFGIADYLHVWPDPDAPGRYVAIDGNQRLSVLREHGVIEVPCLIHEGFTLADAMAFTGTFDRHHARFDEVKQGQLADALISAQPDRRKTFEGLLRPQRVLVRPSTACLSVRPEMSRVSRSGSIAESDRCVLALNVSAEGYEEILSGVLRSRSRLVREARLLEALASLSGREADAVVIELALILATRAKRPPGDDAGTECDSDSEGGEDGLL